MKCKSMLIMLLLLSVNVQAKPSKNYDSLAQDCLSLSSRFESLAKLQYDSHCKSTLTHSDFMVLATAAHLQSHEKLPAYRAIVSVLNDFESGDLSLCQYYRQIISVYRKSADIAYLIKALPDSQSVSLPG